MNYDNICPICFNEFDKDICGNTINIAITKCNHKFCLQCIILHGKRKYHCPLCRSEFIDPSTVSPTNALSEEIRRDQDLIFDMTSQDDMEVEAWYYGNTQSGQTIPRINIAYDASNVTFSVRDENIENLRNEVINRYNNRDQTITDESDMEYHIQHLQNSIYDLAMRLDYNSDVSDESNNEENGEENRN